MTEMTHQYMSSILKSRTLKATSTWDRDTAPETKTNTRRFKEESRPAWTAFAKHRDIFKGHTRTRLKGHVYNSCDLPAITYGAETWTLATQAKNKYAQTKMVRSMLNITYRDRKTNILVRERKKVTDVIEQVRRWKGTWARNVSRIRDNRWTPRITTWKPCERKRPRGRLARRWRDELDDYWKGTMWQRIAQDSQMWKQHPSPNHGTLWLQNDDDVRGM